MFTSIVQELNEVATQFFDDHSFDMQMLVYHWHERSMQAALKRVLAKLDPNRLAAVRHRHKYSLRVMALDDTLHAAVQCAGGAMVCTGSPLELISGDLAFVNLNSEGDDVSVKILYSERKKCFVLRVVTYVTTNVWFSVGNSISGVHQAGLPAMILQENTVIRVGTHHFRILKCRPPRRRMQFQYMIAPVDRKKRDRQWIAPSPDGTNSLCSVEEEIAEDEDLVMIIQCFHPPESTCFNKILSFAYNQGGHELRIGDNDACAFQIVDGSVRGVTARIKALLGHFWLIDGPSDKLSSVAGTYVKVTPVSDPLPLRSSFGSVRLVFEPLNGTRRVCTDVEVVENASD